MKSLYEEIIEIDGVLDFDDRYVTVTVADIDVLGEVDEVMERRGFEIVRIEFLSDGVELVYRGRRE